MTKKNFYFSKDGKSLCCRFSYDEEFLEDVALFCELYLWNKQYEKLGRKIRRLFTKMAYEARNNLQGEKHPDTGLFFEDGYWEGCVE